MSDADPFIVKVDIEGFEADLFSANTQWVGRTPIIITELHNWLIADADATYRTCMVSRMRSEFALGEIIISLELRQRPETSFSIVREGLTRWSSGRFGAYDPNCLTFKCASCRIRWITRGRDRGKRITSMERLRWNDSRIPGSLPKQTGPPLRAVMTCQCFSFG